jgi:hypothetical protein
LSSYFASLIVYGVSPQLLTVISGLLASSAGIVWFVRQKKGAVYA